MINCLATKQSKAGNVLKEVQNGLHSDFFIPSGQHELLLLDSSHCYGPVQLAIFLFHFAIGI